MDRKSCTALPKLAETCHDEIEALAISVGRFVAAGYLTSDACCWDAAHDCAEHMFGPIEGPRLVATIVAVIRALRAERAEPWHFMPANCCRLTRDELSLVKLIGLGRLGNRDAVADAAARLTGCSSAPRLVATVLSAGEMLNGLQDALTQNGFRVRADQAILH